MKAQGEDKNLIRVHYIVLIAVNIVPSLNRIVQFQQGIVFMSVYVSSNNFTCMCSYKYFVPFCNRYNHKFECLLS